MTTDIFLILVYNGVCGC